MNTNTLDMSILARDWRCDEDNTICRLCADGTRPITLDFKAADAEPPVMGKTLIMQARVGLQEIWGIRMLPSGRLLIQPGTGPSRESRYGYPGELALGVSFNPKTGNLAVASDDPHSDVAETFILTTNTPWANPAKGYEIILGTPEGYADRSPLGWRIDCSFRYGETGEEPLRGDPLVRESLYGVVAKAQALFESVQDLDNERHWEAMLALVARGCDLDPQWIANQAAVLVDAHNAWKEGR